MRYDVVVVGAGIAGLYLGQRLAHEGWRVCVLDRRERIGVPVRCGEATGNRTELARFVPIDESWIAREVVGLAVHLDDGSEVRRAIPGTGLVLHRDRFEQSLARAGGERGMEIRLGTPVTGLVWDQARCRGVLTEGGGTVEGAYVVAADGAEGQVARWAGITDTLKPREAFSAMQYTLGSDFADDGFLHFFAGRRTVPGGYLWAFPKGGGRISVGGGLFGVGREPGEIRRYLDGFLEARFPGVERTGLITGSVPLAVCPRRLVRANLLVVGDAARQSNPLTAGGIMNALEAADLATRWIVRCGRNAADIAPLRGYSHHWARGPRRQQKVFLVLKEVFLTFSTTELRRVLDAADSAFAGPIDRSNPFSLPWLRLLRLSRHLAPRAARFASICWK